MPKEFKLKPDVALMAALFAAFPLAGHAAGAARVEFASSGVKALAADGRSRPLAKGAEIANGETIDTGSGRAQVRFSDGAQVSLQPQTRFRIDDYRFAGKADGSEKGFFSLLKGGLRTITGLIGRGNRDNYKVRTAVATIGIRGTEYSVAYGNSINVTTGEGLVEVCNAAGCLIVSSGETAYVADANTRPVMTGKKAELPPPPLEGPIPGFVAGDDIAGGGAPAGVFPVLPSGPGYSLAMAGQIDGGEGSPQVFDGSNSPTSANFDGNGALASFDGGEGQSVAAGVTVGALSDGIIGWGRWASGSFNDYGSPYSMQNVHYVVGIPTPDADMAALGGMVGTYALRGFTYPTASDGTVGALPVSGSMTADFGSYSVTGNLNVPIGAHSYSLDDWDVSISGSKFSGDAYSITSTPGGCSSCDTASIAGFFAGANAARAGLVYQFDGTIYGTISGAAVFGQTGLSPSP